MDKNNSPIKVGDKKEEFSKKGRQIFYQYKDVKFDIDGWANAQEFFPRDFDLCQLKVESGETLLGWRSANNWDGARIKNKTIKFWRKHNLD